MMQCSRMAAARSQLSRAFSSRTVSSPVVAVLFQDIDPPVINGIRKPRKPGGYQDSGADIAYILQRLGVGVITPSATPDVFSQEGWCFSDTEDGILSAVQRGATHLWANTILFSSHPLQTSTELTPISDTLRVIGQPPRLVEDFDDKAYLNAKLRETGAFSLPQSWVVDASASPSRSRDVIKSVIDGVASASYPVVGKPVRGRGSHGVKVCRSPEELRGHVETLLLESPIVMLEEFLAGEEATLTVFPPDAHHDHYWCLPPVTRFNHADGIAPYNGVVAVTKNSRMVSPEEMAADPAYGEVMDQCAGVAELIKTTAPIRIDVRRRREGGAFVLFDINMKPNMTGPGRPGREDQASLSAIAASGVGWDYPTLLLKMLQCSRTLAELRNYFSPF
ncbi:hypothetical protein MAP00_006184 [Monascus purpureus]|nr:hypothetical protein MAP00_006184 [Monascus purpureus]